MRIADNMLFDQVRNNVGKNRSEQADLQNQAATQKRVTKPSDDPVASARILSSRVDLAGNKQFLKNLNYAKSFLEFTDQSLGELTENLVRAKELAINQASDASGNQGSRALVAAEVEQIHNQLVSIGNRKLGERFIFGGYRTTTAPFNLEGRYFGDSGEMLIHSDKPTFMAMNVPGDYVFLGQGRSKTPPQAVTIEEFHAQSPDPLKAKLGEIAPTPTEVRGPSSIDNLRSKAEPLPDGVNVFNALKALEISLRTNDKAGIQESLDTLDRSITQVVQARAEVGSRVTALNNIFETLQKAKVDNQTDISQQEDADVFSVVSDINKNESALHATMQTSTKMIQQSLLDFLR